MPGRASAGGRTWYRAGESKVVMLYFGVGHPHLGVNHLAKQNVCGATGLNRGCAKHVLLLVEGVCSLVQSVLQTSEPGGYI